MSKIPFPQANDLGKLLKLIENFNYLTSNELMNKLELGTRRQLEYYKSAGLFLGFFEKTNKYKLSNSGALITKTETYYRKKIYIIELLKAPLLRALVFNYEEKKIFDILNNFQSFKELSTSTKLRRISTIRTWIMWLNFNI